MVLAQLEKAGLLSYLTVVASTPSHVTGTVAPYALDGLIDWLRHDKNFACGILHGLHADVGPDRIDFRSHRGAFGKRSLQIVISRGTGNFYADCDVFSPYSDVVGFLGHAFGEVVPGWLRGWRT